MISVLSEREIPFDYSKRFRMESVTIDSPDEDVDWYIEQNRQAYYEEYFAYLRENGDGFFVF